MSYFSYSYVVKYTFHKCYKMHCDNIVISSDDMIACCKRLADFFICGQIQLKHVISIILTTLITIFMYRKYCNIQLNVLNSS